jgi:hypothetical protein
MKFTAFSVLIATLLAIAGCTSDDGGGRVIDTRPQFDRQGNPNFDTRGNYIGCHGVGCAVDQPDDAQSSNDDVDDRPQFDREGNPNFDTQGNYQGCNGIGCEVDQPDDDGSSGGDG